MVDSLDDGRDFNKARGFLLTYSALVLALWYFGADLTQFKLMGNEVQLHQRTNSVWLVLAALNAYFWFRCYQRIPPNGLYFDKAMSDIYEASLQNLGLTLTRPRLRKKIKSEMSSRGMENVQYKIEQYSSRISYRPTRDKTTRLRYAGLKSRILLEEYRVQVFTTAQYGYRTDGGAQSSTVHEYQYIYAYFTWAVKLYSIFKGALVTPWFTDHIAPLLFGGMSTAFALWKWYSINFIASSLQHHTLICAGVSTATHGQLSFLL